MEREGSPHNFDQTKVRIAERRVVVQAEQQSHETSWRLWSDIDTNDANCLAYLHRYFIFYNSNVTEFENHFFSQEAQERAETLKDSVRNWANSDDYRPLTNEKRNHILMIRERRMEYHKSAADYRKKVSINYSLVNVNSVKLLKVFEEALRGPPDVIRQIETIFFDNSKLLRVIEEVERTVPLMEVLKRLKLEGTASTSSTNNGNMDTVSNNSTPASLPSNSHYHASVSQSNHGSQYNVWVQNVTNQQPSSYTLYPQVSQQANNEMNRNNHLMIPPPFPIHQAQQFLVPSPNMFGIPHQQQNPTILRSGHIMGHPPPVQHHGYLQQTSQQPHSAPQNRRLNPQQFSGLPMIQNANFPSCSNGGVDRSRQKGKSKQGNNKGSTGRIPGAVRQERKVADIYKVASGSEEVRMAPPTHRNETSKISRSSIDHPQSEHVPEALVEVNVGIDGQANAVESAELIQVDLPADGSRSDGSSQSNCSVTPTLSGTKDVELPVSTTDKNERFCGNQGSEACEKTEEKDEALPIESIPLDEIPDENMQIGKENNKIISTKGPKKKSKSKKKKEKLILKKLSDEKDMELIEMFAKRDEKMKAEQEEQQLQMRNDFIQKLKEEYEIEFRQYKQRSIIDFDRLFILAQAFLKMRVSEMGEEGGNDTKIADFNRIVEGSPLLTIDSQERIMYLAEFYGTNNFPHMEYLTIESILREAA